MTLTPDAPACSPTRVAGYALTRHALDQMAERGIDADQVARVILNPSYRLRGGMHANDNLTIYTDPRRHVITAVLRSHEVQELVEASQRKVIPTPQVSPEQPVVERRRKPRAAPVARSHVLDSIHPALRAEITRLVDGDWTRLVVHSSTNVEIKPN